MLRPLKRKNGAWMLAEPFGKDKVENNLNPIWKALCFAPTQLPPGDKDAA
jgi:hypothetical protein